MQRRLTQPVVSGARTLAGLFSVEEVAHIIGRHPEVVRRQARAGRLPGQKIGRGWFFAAERLAGAGYPQFLTDARGPGSVSSDPLVVALSQAGLEALQLLDRDAIFQAVGRRLAEVGLTSYFFLLDEDANGLTVAYAHTGEAASAVQDLIGQPAPGTHLPFERIPVLQRAVETRQPQYLGGPDDLIKRTGTALASPPSKAGRLGQILHLRTAISAPLVARDRVLGAITVLGPDLREGQVAEMMAFANQTAAAVENARLLTESRQLEEAMVLALAMAVEMRDAVASQPQCAALAERFAAYLGLDEIGQRRVRNTALLQDIGKLGIPDAILKKQRRLTSDERAVLMTHPVLAANLLQRFRALEDLAPLVRAHHEWYNGEGYPDRLTGEAIPRETRVVSVVNAFFGLIHQASDRSEGMLDDAIEELRHFAGTGLDPAMVDALVQMIDSGRRNGEDWYQRLMADAGQPSAPSAAPPGPRDFLTAADSRELQIIYRIAQETSAVLEFDVLLKRIVAIIRDVMDYYQVSLLLPSETPGELRVGAHDGYTMQMSDIAIPPGLGITGWVFAHGTPEIVPDVKADPRYVGLDPNVKSELAFPLISRGRVIGVLNAESQYLNAFTEADVALMSAVGSQLTSSLEAAQLHETLKREATHDPLTYLLNRRILLERMEQEIAQADRRGGLSVVFLDVDNLKRINDSFGHLAGDALLREVAQALTDAVRGEDVVARFGGDEFVVLLPATPAPAAAVVAQRILDRVARHRFVAGAQTLSLPSVSLGLATYPEHGLTAEALLAAADMNLYEQKRKAS